MARVKKWVVVKGASGQWLVVYRGRNSGPGWSSVYIFYRESVAEAVRDTLNQQPQYPEEN